MSYTSEHNRMRPVLAQASKWDIAENPDPKALFETLTAGFNIWCTPEDHPKGWDGCPMDAGAFAKPCAFVGTAIWGFDEETETIVRIDLETDAYDLQRAGMANGNAHNRTEDLQWARRKIHWLFEQASVECPDICVGE